MMKIEQDGEDEVFVPVPEEDFEQISAAYLAACDEDEEEDGEQL